MVNRCWVLVLSAICAADAFVYRTWTAMQITHAPDLDLQAVDTGAFNHSGALTVLADEIVYARARSGAEALCGPTASLFRYTPYRVHANWSQPGALGAWAPVDPSGRRVARGLRWWVCADPAPPFLSVAHAWAPSATTDCGVPLSSADASVGTHGLVATHVCVAGTYVLGAAPCTDGAPHGADCIQCTEGVYGCACEFTHEGYHDVDPEGAATAWLVAILMGAPYAIEVIFARRIKDRAAHIVRVLFHVLAASLLLAQSIDVFMVHAGRIHAYAATSLAFSVLYAVSVPVLAAPVCRRNCCAPREHPAVPDSDGMPPQRPVCSVRRVLVGVTPALFYGLQAMFQAVYYDPPTAWLGATLALMCVYAILQASNEFMETLGCAKRTPLTRRLLATLCALLSFTYVMPLRYTPCARTTSTG